MKEEKNWLEWTVFGFSLLITLSLLTYLVYISFKTTTSDPELEVNFKPVKNPRDNNAYQVTLYNKGNSTAEDVKVKVVIWKDGKEEESAEIQFPFSPKKSSKDGWLSLANDTLKADSVTSRVMGYIKP